ncbi:PAS domain-containing protein [Nafulsella turpanensis]|uniref:PAS domain-containing protein n=1 Tax=Nafulsella turpanensis TaxID=1265690 RepID=UPI00034D9EA0|nr:PAS domain-containing protein [Nafulsella turpanensis]
MTRFPMKATALCMATGAIWLGGSMLLLLSLKDFFNATDFILFHTFNGLTLVFLNALLLNTTLRKRFRQLQQSSQWYQQLFKEGPLPRLVYDPISLQILEVNKAACQQYGYAEEELVRLHLQDLWAEPFPLEEWKKKEGPAASVMTLHRKKCGTRFYAQSLSSGPVHQGRGVRLLVLLDVNNRMLAEEKTKNAEEEIRKLSLVAEATQNAVIITNDKGQVEWVNEGFTRQTGYTLEEVKGKKPGSFLQGPGTDPKAVDFLREHLRLQKKFKVELLNYRKDNSPYWVRLFITPVFNEAGALIQYIAIETDITERMQFIAKLERQNQQLKNIARISSHEIRRPVASILGLVNLFDSREADPQFHQEVIQYLKLAGKELDEVIHLIVNKTYELEELEK